MSEARRPESIAREIRDEIQRGRHRPGERLPSEREPAEQHGVHRGSAREALKILAQQRLIEVQPGGARVIPVHRASLDVLAHLLEAPGGPDAALMEQLLDVHELLLVGAARLAVERASDAELARALDLVDASAMLMRLQLRGVAVGDRWQAVADRWAAALGDGGAGQYAFNDVHAMLAYAAADRQVAQTQLLATMRDAAARDDDNGGFTRDVGLPLAEAVVALAHGDAARAVPLLRDVRPIAHRFGGSHAQRDLIDLTLVEAALRGGDRALATALAAERRALRPASPLAGRLLQRAQALRAAPETA